MSTRRSVADTSHTGLNSNANITHSNSDDVECRKPKASNKGKSSPRRNNGKDEGTDHTDSVKEAEMMMTQENIITTLKGIFIVLRSLQTIEVFGYYVPIRQFWAALGLIILVSGLNGAIVILAFSSAYTIYMRSTRNSVAPLGTKFPCIGRLMTKCNNLRSKAFGGSGDNATTVASMASTDPLQAAGSAGVDTTTKGIKAKVEMV